MVGRHIEFEWFGVDVRFQKKKVMDEYSLAQLLFRVSEDAARNHPDSEEDMPMTLTCDVSNERGLGFWASQGFHEIKNADLRVEKGRYLRLVR